MKISYLGLGSNINPRKVYLKKAIEYFENNPQIKVLAKSSLYETAPVGFLEQQCFLNMAIKIGTGMDPFALLKFCQQIEQKLKRKRTIHWGPRTIDIDLLLYANMIIKSKNLTIPHPEMLKRSFVLVPLSEIAPELTINQIPITEYRDQITDQSIKIYQARNPF